MKKTIALILAVVLCLSAVPAVSAAGTDGATFGFHAEEYPAADGGDVVANLRVNYEIAPNCVDGAPVFSWNLISSVRGAKQVSYRVKVAQSENALSSGDLVWDSGTVRSRDAVGIACPADLLEATRYYWNVDVTNERGETVKSAPASFVTALTQTGFDGADWITQEAPETAGIDLTGANWIWQSDEANKSQHSVAVLVEWFRNLIAKIADFFAKLFGESYPKPYEDVVYFRKEFSIDKSFASAYAVFTADDHGELYVNGRLAVSREEGAPGEAPARRTSPIFWKKGKT